MSVLLHLKMVRSSNTLTKTNFLKVFTATRKEMVLESFQTYPSIMRETSATVKSKGLASLFCKMGMSTKDSSKIIILMEKEYTTGLMDKNMMGTLRKG